MSEYSTSKNNHKPDSNNNNAGVGPATESSLFVEGSILDRLNKKKYLTHKIEHETVELSHLLTRVKNLREQRAGKIRFIKYHQAIAKNRRNKEEMTLKLLTETTDPSPKMVTSCMQTDVEDAPAPETAVVEAVVVPSPQDLVEIPETTTEESTIPPEESTNATLHPAFAAVKDKEGTIDGVKQRHLESSSLLHRPPKPTDLWGGRTLRVKAKPDIILEDKPPSPSDTSRTRSSISDAIENFISQRPRSRASKRHSTDGADANSNIMGNNRKLKAGNLIKKLGDNVFNGFKKREVELDDDPSLRRRRQAQIVHTDLALNEFRVSAKKLEVPAEFKNAANKTTTDDRTLNPVKLKLRNVPPPPPPPPLPSVEPSVLEEKEEHHEEEEEDNHKVVDTERLRVINRKLSRRETYTSVESMLLDLEKQSPKEEELKPAENDSTKPIADEYSHKVVINRSEIKLGGKLKARVAQHRAKQDDNVEKADDDDSEAEDEEFSSAFNEIKAKVRHRGSILKQSTSIKKNISVTWAETLCEEHECPDSFYDRNSDEERDSVEKTLLDVVREAQETQSHSGRRGSYHPNKVLLEQAAHSIVLQQHDKVVPPTVKETTVPPPPPVASRTLPKHSTLSKKPLEKPGRGRLKSYQRKKSVRFRAGRKKMSLFSTVKLRLCGNQSIRSYRKMRGGKEKYRGLWKAACQQVMYMNKLQFTASLKSAEERGLRNLSLSPVSLICAVSMFYHLDKSDLEGIIARSFTMTYSAGETLFQGNAPAKRMYIIKEGNVISQSALSVVRDRLFTTGDHLGLSELIAGSTYSFSAVAVGAVECLVLDSSTFTTIKGKLQESIANNEDEFSELPQDDSLSDWLDQFVSDVMLRVPTEYEKAHPQNFSSEIGLVKQILITFTPELSIDDIFERLYKTLRTAFKTSAVRIYEVDEELQTLLIKVSHDTKGGTTIPFRQDTSASDVIVTGETYYDENTQSIFAPVFVNDVVRFVLKVSKELTDDDNHPLKLLNTAAQELEKYIERYEVNTDSNRVLSNYCIPIFTLSLPFTVSIQGLTLSTTDHKEVSISAGIYHGETLLTKTLAHSSASVVRRSENTEATFAFDEWLQLDIRLQNLPLASRIIFYVNGKKGTKKVIGWAAYRCFNFVNELVGGEVSLGVLPGSNANNTIDDDNIIDTERCTGCLDVEFTTFDLPVRHKSDTKERITPPASHVPKAIDYSSLDASSSLAIQKLLRDPLAQSDAASSEKIWKLLTVLCHHASALPRFLLSVDWANRKQVEEAYQYMYLWQTPTYLEALQLLGRRFPDPRVRSYAVSCLDALSDSRLKLYLLQLVQSLKFEAFDDSALARFLIYRGLMSPETVGPKLFWYLLAEYHVVESRMRFGSLLNQYMTYASDYRVTLRHSLYMMGTLRKIAESVKKVSSSTLRLEVLHKALTSSLLPDSFQLPINSKLVFSNFDVQKCRVLDSKKKPLLLNMRVIGEQEPYALIFKAGDDLRQDQLTLQMLKVVDDLWKGANLDLCLLPYRCVSTGDHVGFIEVVNGAETIASIIRSLQDGKGGFSKKLAAAKNAYNNDSVLLDWLASSSSTNKKGGTATRRSSSAHEQKTQAQAKLATVRGNFARSCAGYCVATYVFGIGDRHNDNIMIQRKTGKLFHIDFGHFLGNFKKKLGIKRERAPFVFTPAMAAVIGSQEDDLYQYFMEVSVEAFLTLRRHAALLVSLFSLMLSSGIPELKSEEDIVWIQETLMLDLSDDDASKKFKQLIYTSLHTKATKVNDMVHLLAH